MDLQKWFDILAGSNIRARHEIIKPVIGVFPEEEEAYTLVSRLMWLLPTIVVLGAVLDFALFYLFNTKFHPWAGILSQTQSKLEEENKKQGKDDEDQSDNKV